jgi:hypothetical protein
MTNLYLKFQAIGTVNDYNPLMKDFPINDMLSATELDRIRLSVQVKIINYSFYFFVLSEIFNGQQVHSTL